MNIQDLNAVIILNIYSLFLQTNIIITVKNTFYINIVNCVSFFY